MMGSRGLNGNGPFLGSETSAQNVSVEANGQFPWRLLLSVVLLRQ